MTFVNSRQRKKVMATLNENKSSTSKFQDRMKKNRDNSKKVTIKLYNYDDLSKEEKEKAYSEYEDFLRNNPSEYEDDKGIMHKDNIDEWKEIDRKEYVEDTIRANDYLFYKNGNMAHVVHYTGKHPKSGKTELKIEGETFEVKE